MDVRSFKAPPNAPLAYVEINPPLRVKLLKAAGGLKAGDIAYAGWVYSNGKVALYKLPDVVQGIGNPVDFDALTEAPLEAANTNGKA